MKQFFIALCVVVVASAQVYGYSAGSGYQNQEFSSDAGAGEYSHIADDGGAGILADGAGYGGAGSGGVGSGGAGSGGEQSINPNNKGEILIHRPADIIVKRPPTRVVVNHPPLVVKPAPVVLHKPPTLILRKMFVKNHPRPVKFEPVFVNVVKPQAEEFFVNDNQQFASGAQGFAPANLNAGYASGGQVADGENGYQLVQNNQALAGLAKLFGSDSCGQNSAASHSSHNALSY